MSRGARYERRLVRALTASRFGAVRIPTSGSGTDADLPDVLASRRVQLHRQPSPRVSVDDGDDGALRTLSDAWAIEVKSGSQTTLYADEGEVEQLARFAGQWGAKPLIAARFTDQASATEYFLVRPMDCRTTDGGRYGVPAADAAERAFAVVEDGDEPSVRVHGGAAA
jgi:Holliday junction resolvase